MSGFVIREAQPGDLDALLGLCRAHAEYERAPIAFDGWTQRQHAAMFHSQPRLRCLVVGSGTRVEGYATFTRDFSTWRAAEYLHVDCVYVSEGSRGRGMGAALMGAIAREAAGLGITHLEWQTPSWNLPAVRFYERLGAMAVPKVRFAWNPGHA